MSGNTLFNSAQWNQMNSSNFGLTSGLPNKSPVSFTTSPLGQGTSKAGSTGSSLFSQESLFGDNGWAMPALNTAMGLGNLYMGVKNYGLAKKSFEVNTDALKTNLANQSRLVNQEIQRRESVRRKYNPNDVDGSTMSEHMKKWGVSGKLGETSYQGNGG